MGDAEQRLRIVISARNLTARAFGAARDAVKGFREELSKTGGTVDLLAKGFAALSTVEASFRTAAAIVSGMRGDTEAAWHAAEQIPLGIGAAIRAGREFADVLFFASQSAEQIKERLAHATVTTTGVLKIDETLKALNKARGEFVRDASRAGLEGVDREIDAADRAAEKRIEELEKLRRQGHEAARTLGDPNRGEALQATLAADRAFYRARAASEEQHEAEVAEIRKKAAKEQEDREKDQREKREAAEQKHAERLAGFRKRILGEDGKRSREDVLAEMDKRVREGGGVGTDEGRRAIQEAEAELRAMAADALKPKQGLRGGVAATRFSSLFTGLTERFNVEQRTLEQQSLDETKRMREAIANGDVKAHKILEDIRAAILNRYSAGEYGTARGYILS